MVCSDCDCNRVLNINGEFIESSRWIYLSDSASYYSTWSEVSNVA